MDITSMTRQILEGMDCVNPAKFEQHIRWVLGCELRRQEAAANLGRTGTEQASWQWIVEDKQIHVEPLWEDQIQVRRLGEPVTVELLNGTIVIDGQQHDIGDSLPQFLGLFDEAEEQMGQPFLSSKEE